MSLTKTRNPAMDVVRLVALFTVVAVHFFLNINFTSAPVQGMRMYVMTAVRYFFMICVPLFMVLSGYLMKNKTLSKSYYKGIIKTLAVYLLASVACAAYAYISSPETFSAMGEIWGIFDFSTAKYSWYVEMYIGLFLLIPFLNLIYNNLQTKKHKLALIVTLIFLTVLPSLLNSFQVLNFDWWLKPSLNVEGSYDILIPDWWVMIYPITYYFIGCYLREYPIKMKASANLLLIIACAVVFGAYECYRSYGANYLWDDHNGHNSLFVLIQTVLVFSFFANLKYKHLGIKSQKVLKYLSGLVLGAYLCSEIFDDIFYKMLNEAVPNIPLRLNYFFIIVPAVYVCSLALSAVLNLVYSGISSVCTKIFSRKKNIKTTH